MTDEEKQLMRNLALIVGVKVLVALAIHKLAKRFDAQAYSNGDYIPTYTGLVQKDGVFIRHIDSTDFKKF